MRNAIIDWLSLTIDVTESDKYPPGMPDEYTDAPAHRGYNLSRQFVPDGRKESVHTENVAQGCHIVYSGRCLNWMRENGHSDLDIIAHYRKIDARITRLDVAIDVKNEGLKIDDLAEEMDQKRAITNVRKWNRITGAEGQGTLYIGSRQSEAMVRVYDKAAEQKIDGDYVRIECELKGSKAMQMVDRLTDDPENAGALIQAAVLSVVKFHNPVWNDVVHSDIEMALRTEKLNESDTAGWLLKSVAPAMAKYMITHGDNGLFERFQAEVLHQYADQLKAMQKSLITNKK